MVAIVGRRRGDAASPSAVDDALSVLAWRQDGRWLVRCRAPGTDLLAGHPARGTVLEIAGDDRPLIVTSVEEELRAHRVRVLDLTPLSFGAERDGDGGLRRMGPARTAEHPEAFLQIELDHEVDEAGTAELVASLRSLLSRLVVVTDDHAPIRARLAEAARSLEASEGEAPRAVTDAVATVEWMLDGNALMLGLGRRALSGDRSGGPVAGAPDLGLLRAEPPTDLETDGWGGGLIGRDQPLRVSRLATLSPLHRRVPLLRLDLWVPGDDVDGGGFVEHLLWVVSRRAAGAPLASVPLLRQKLDRLLEAEDVIPGSYDEQHLTLLFQSLPEDDLFSLDADVIRSLVAELSAEDRDHSVRVVMRPVADARAVAALVTVPVERWNRTLRERLERFLLAQLDGERVDVALSIGGGSSAVTARFVVHVQPDHDVPEHLDAVAREVRMVCQSWEEQLVAGVADEAADTPGLDIDPTVVGARWAGRLPESYRDAVAARDAVPDVLQLEAMAAAAAAAPTMGDALGSMRVWFGRRRAPDQPERLCLVADGSIDLSSLVPELESLDLWVTDEARWPAGDGLFLHHLGVRIRAGGGGLADGSPGRPPTRRLAGAEDGARLADAIVALVVGPAEVDGLNRLVLHAGLTWRDIAVLRAYRRYRHQVAPADDEAYVDEVLVSHPDIARALIAQWHARFDPCPSSGERTLRAAVASRAVNTACDALPRLDHDRILRGLVGTIDATLRTNRDLRPEGPLALKLDPTLVPGAPHPRPHREVFVSGATVEGVHLRAGPVARGGLRASDRDQDYRAEVLDLMRAQVLKNAVIVPTGAKGGFVLRDGGRHRRTTSGPTDRRAQVEAAYDAFVGALLDITDDLEGDAVRAVPGRWDDDDPYLVVAADKGTATFSDRANALAEARGFWLGDAFASGGSQGYDHKALGITARGAWVAIGRHLRALGLDPDRDEITLAGVGDMSGDVFGNGLLRSNRLRLVAAFDHRHVFLDPNPDPEMSYRERRRLFEMAGSSWADYDPKLLSVGGGIHSRSAKAVPLTAEVKAALRVGDDELTPAGLVRAVLSAPVDLLYFGGIGTYVRASTEDDARVDDRANAEVRVSGRDLRARVVGEGANLALTQRARVEVARRGGRINVDAIDNSAGVDCSDHEVNLKVLLSGAESDGRIDRSERDALLQAHAEDVVAAVLDDCASQSDALDRAERATPAGMDVVAVVQRRLVADRVLDPVIEALPDDREIEARASAGAGFTRPELAVLLAGVKRRVVADLLASDLPDHPVTRDALVGYFPPALAERFDDLLDGHRLRRELVASEVANDLVDHLGLTAVVELADEVGVGTDDVAVAYWVVRAVVRAPERWATLASERGATDPDLDPEPADGGDLLAALLRTLTRSELVRRRRDLRRGGTWDPVARIEADRLVADAVVAHLDDDPEPRRSRERARLGTRLVAGGLAPAAAAAAALAPELEMVADVAEVARDLDRDVVTVVGAFRAIDDRLGLDELRRRTAAADAVGEWSLRARQGLVDDLVGLRREAARRALEEAGPGPSADDAVEAHLATNPVALTEADAVRRRLASDSDAGLDGLAVAVRAVRRAAL